MRKIFRSLGLALLVAAILVVAVAGAAFAAGSSKGPAPYSGDCVPDGSGFEVTTGANPDAGDCIPDDCVPNDYSWSHNYLTPRPDRE